MRSNQLIALDSVVSLGLCHEDLLELHLVNLLLGNANLNQHTDGLSEMGGFYFLPITLFPDLSQHDRNKFPLDLWM